MAMGASVTIGVRHKDSDSMRTAGCSQLIPCLMGRCQSVAIIDGINGIDKAIKNLKHKGGSRLKKLHGGIDVGSEQHHVIIMDDKEKILYDREVAHKYRRTERGSGLVSCNFETRLIKSLHGKTVKNRI
ncbi:MAG: hypothetical protein IEMM0007_1758 [bacterium]|nr:MAG: hypothetical protein IEMM0007_1758 [bacterium]